MPPSSSVRIVGGVAPQAGQRVRCARFGWGGRRRLGAGGARRWWPPRHRRHTLIRHHVPPHATHVWRGTLAQQLPCTRFPAAWTHVPAIPLRAAAAAAAAATSSLRDASGNLCLLLRRQLNLQRLPIQAQRLELDRPPRLHPCLILEIALFIPSLQLPRTKRSLLLVPWVHVEPPTIIPIVGLCCRRCRCQDRVVRRLPTSAHPAAPVPSSSSVLPATPRHLARQGTRRHSCPPTPRAP
jgi:hypothetical protein